MKTTRVCVLAAALTAAWAARAAAQSDEIYREDRVATFTLTMSTASWDAICNDGTGQGDQWQRATMVWEGETVDGVGVKRSGVSESQHDSPKPSIRISFNEFEFANPAGPGTPGRKWKGVNRIKLDSNMWDAAQMKDRIAYKINRDIGGPSPRSCHARLVVNGTYIGLYEVEEPVRKDFVQVRWNEDSGNLYNVSSQQGSAYNWRGSDPASYVPSPFFAETNYPGGDYRDIVNVINTVNNVAPDQIRTQLASYINVDGFLRHLAMVVVIEDGDDMAAWHGGSNNHYWYHRAGTNRLEIIDWDCDASQGTWSGFPDGETPIDYKWDNVKMTAWIRNDATAWNTVKTKIREILDGPVAAIHGRIDTIYAQIKPHVYADTLKGQNDLDPNGYTNQEFEDAVVYAKNWWNKRVAYLRGQIGTPTALPTVTLSASTPNAAEPSTAAAFTVTRTGATTSSLTVLRTRTGTATSPDDYDPLPSPIVIPAGQASVTIPVTPVDDSLVEGNETVILTLSADPAYTVGTASSATVTIADNDTAPPPTLPTVTIIASDPDAAEPSATGAFTVTRTGPTTSALTVFRVRSGTAVSPDDYTPLPSPFVIPVGQASVTITVTPVDDSAVEGPETLTVTLSPDPGYTIGAASSATVTIADNDTAPPPTLPTVTITASDPDAAEPSATGAFTVTRTGPTTSALTILRVRSGTAVSPDDYTPLPSPFVIPAGQASVTITVTPVDDSAVEGPETLTVTLSPDPAYTIGAASSATVTIADNDAGTGGLSATYYDNEDFTGTSVTRTDPTIDFNWAAASPAPSIGPDTFSSRWTGRLRAQYGETYTFYTFTNDGVRLWVEGELLVDKWVEQSGGIEWSAQVALQAGQWYTVQMDHYEGVGNAVAQLSWSSPSTSKQIIPRSALDPALGAPDSRDNDGDGVPNDADLDDDNDGIPDLQDPDRDGDTLTNLAEVASGSDPNDATSPNAGGTPAAVSDGDNPNGDAWINDKCGGSISTRGTGRPALLGIVALLFLCGLGSVRERR